MTNPDSAALHALIRAKFPAWSESRSLMRQLSSIELLELVEAIEKEFGVRFSPLDLEETNFESSAALLKLIEKLKSASR